MAKKNPSTRWFFRDWHTDEALQVCSLAARGAWIELLGICAENGGYLLINDKPPSITAMARYVGATPAMMRRLLKELGDAGVYSRTDDGVIFNRRMVRAFADHKTSNGPNGQRDPRQADLLDDDRLSHASERDKAFKLSGFPPVDFEPESESPLPAREVEKNDEGESFERPVGASGCTSGPRTMGHLVTGLSRRVARPPPDRSSSAVERRAENPRGGGSSPPFGTNCRPARAARPRPPPKSAALKAQIKQQLTAKHGRFLQASGRPGEVGAYWGALLDDDPAVAQRMFDAVDRRMRAAGWDDMRDWKAR